MNNSPRQVTIVVSRVLTSMVALTLLAALGLRASNNSKIGKA